LAGGAGQPPSVGTTTGLGGPLQGVSLFGSGWAQARAAQVARLAARAIVPVMV
jgi:hypothetical protein